MLDLFPESIWRCWLSPLIRELIYPALLPPMGRLHFYFTHVGAGARYSIRLWENGVYGTSIHSGPYFCRLYYAIKNGTLDSDYNGGQLDSVLGY